nr:hypothetical protein Q903MT_gene5289 [Picea sitchensis]
MVTMVTWILALMCSGFRLLVFPFPLLILGSILVLFLLEPLTWLSFLVAYIFQVLCLHTFLINCLWLEEHHLLS